jgi:hypothetical protein
MSVSSATNLISSSPIDHSRGRASIIDGGIIYSPNCGRSVKIPLTPLLPPDIEFLLNTGQHVDTLHQPLWWSQETAFLAFLPINPDFAGVPFEDFNNTELRRGRTGYFMRGDAVLKSKQTETLLQDLIRSFADTYEIPKIKTWRICGRMLPNEVYPHRGLFQFMLKYAKGWLTLYMAILAYIMAVAQEIDKDVLDDDTQQPTWFIKMDHYDQILLSGLRSYTAYTHAVQRVGIFLEIVEPPIHQVSIDFLIKYCVPVWYRWGPEEISMAKRDNSLDRLAPPPDHLQRATQFLTKVPSPQTAIPDRPWVEFFEKRQKDLQFLTRSEVPLNRQRRLDRERNPPTVNTKVYVWSRGSNGKFERQIVVKRDNDETLSRYRTSQKVYNSLWNEWDCCYHFADSSAAEMEEADWSDSDEEDLDLPEAPYETMPAQTTSGTPSSNPPTTPPSLPTVIHPDFPEVPMAQPTSSPPPTTPPAPPTVEQPATRWVPHFRAPDRAHTYDVQTYPATENLHHFYGFVPPIPVPRRHPRPATLSEKDFRLFAAIVNEDGLNEGFRDSTIMQYCHDFVKGLQRNATPPNELFDLAIGNSKCIRGVDRIRFLRKRGTDSISLVLPAATVPWDLTVTNAIDALFLCRLGASMTEVELCHALLDRGVQFRTLLPISRHTRPSSIPRTILPIRGVGYAFTATDYAAYVQERAALLLCPRRRRAAIMSGGIVWRLVVSEVSFHEAFDGPTTATTIHGRGLFLPSPESDYNYCDDTLSESEAEAISGRIYCYTGMRLSLFFFRHTYLSTVGRGPQREERSWWPTDRQWKAFIAHTRWGEQLEKFFKQRERALEAGEAKPLNATEWRKQLRSAQVARMARSNMEGTANKFLESFFT